MSQTSFALMTNVGRAKEAAALANGTTIQITQIAIGDGATVPSGGETALYHEVARKSISGHGTVVGADNVAYFDCYLAAADGPYTIYEAGLYDSAGALIAIAHYDPPINKPVPASGQTVEGTVRLEVAFSNVATVMISVDPSMQVALQRLTRLPWIPIIELYRNAPPSAPVPGDAYVVGSSATGSWAGNAGKVTEYTLAGWAMMTPPPGHGVSLPDGRIYELVDGTYIQKIAQDVQSGKWAYAEDTGSPTVLAATLTPATAVLTKGMVVYLKTANISGNAPVFNLDAHGNVPIVNNSDGLPLVATALGGVAGSIVKLTYDGTVWRFDAGAIYLINTAITKTVFGAGADFADLNAAFYWASKFIITQTGSLTLIMPAGQSVQTSTVVMDHPNGNRIFIVGAGALSPVVSGFTFTGSSGAALAADKASALAYLRTRFQSELRFTAGAQFGITTGSGFTLRDLLITGDGSQASYLINTQVPSLYLSNVAIHGSGGAGNLGVVSGGVSTTNWFSSTGSAGSGIVVGQGATFGHSGTLLCSSNSVAGVTIYSGVFQGGVSNPPASFRNNNGPGIQIIHGIVDLSNASAITANAGVGISVVMGTAGIRSPGSIYNNGSYGIFADASFVQCLGCYISGNAGFTVYAFNGSNVNGTGSNLAGTTSPAVMTTGNNDSWISN